MPILFPCTDCIRPKVRFSIPAHDKVVVYMADEVSVIDVKAMADLLDTRRKHGKRTLLFLGARAGGLYRSYAFYDSLKTFSKLNFAKMSRPKQFEECYELLKPSLNLFSDA